MQASPHNADSGYPSLHVELPSGKRYRFARLIQQNGQWQIDPNYQINLTTYIPPVGVSISGPMQLDDGQQGTGTATASGGDGVMGREVARLVDGGMPLGAFCGSSCQAELSRTVPFNSS